VKNNRGLAVFLGNLGKDNPVFVQILGICSTLAVTNSVRNTFVMCLGLIFTTALSGTTVSLLRFYIPQRIRMIVTVLIIAVYVIIVDIVLKAWYHEIARELGPYVGLIITNCIVMGRAEAFALQNNPLLSMLDGFSSGMGYTWVLLIIAVIREFFGAGTVWNIKIFDAWTNWTIMIMAPGAFFVLALFIWIVKSFFIREKL